MPAIELRQAYSFEQGGEPIPVANRVPVDLVDIVCEGRVNSPRFRLSGPLLVLPYRERRGWVLKSGAFSS
jgi:hypothetical protein